MVIRNKNEEVKGTDPLCQKRHTLIALSKPLSLHLKLAMFLVNQATVNIGTFGFS